MIREIAVELQTQLRLRACPFPVLVGPESTKTTSFGGRERVVLEYDRDGQDDFDAPKVPRTNPPRRYIVHWAGKVTIYARSPAAGAVLFEHERRALSVRDQVLVGMYAVAKKRQNAWGQRSGRLFTPEDLVDAEVPAGAGYELKFWFDRSVDDVTWKGEGKPTVAFKRMKGAPLLTFAEVGATGDTITRSSGSWIADGFAVGDTITVGGSDLNNVTGPIAALSATVLTLGATDLANEGPVGGCRVTAGTIGSTTKVSLTSGPDDDDDPSNVPADAETACGG